MKNDKPKDVEEYKNWLKSKFDIEILSSTKTYYEQVSFKIKTDFEKYILWNELNRNLKDYDEEYLLITKGYHLLAEYNPSLLLKPFNSFLLKTYRINIIDNRKWPDEPAKGWVLPNNWFSRINDIVRTMIVVKYLDGVEFMIEKIKDLCAHQKKDCNVYLEAREEGYYAAHLYLKHNFEIPKLTWDTERVDIIIEIQLTTQLQEVIKKLLHKYYEEKREAYKKEDIKWQWNYKCDEFVANYLGHILHYVEGMIMDVREKQKEIK